MKVNKNNDCSFCVWISSETYCDREMFIMRVKSQIERMKIDNLHTSKSDGHTECQNKMLYNVVKKKQMLESSIEKF